MEYVALIVLCRAVEMYAMRLSAKRTALCKRATTDDGARTAGKAIHASTPHRKVGLYNKRSAPPSCGEADTVSIGAVCAGFACQRLYILRGCGGVRYALKAGFEAFITSGRSTS